MFKISKISNDLAYLRSNALSLLSLQATTYALPLIITPYLVRILGVDGFGRIAFTMAIVHYLVVFADYGFDFSATRQVALLRDSPVGLSRLVNSVLVLKGILLLLGSIGLAGIVAAVPTFSDEWQLFLAVWLAALGHVVFPVWLIQGLERMEIVTRCMVGAQVAMMVSIFVFVHEPGDYLIAAGLQAATPLLAGVVSWFMLHSVIRVSPIWPGASFLRETIVDGWHVFISTVAISFYTATNTVVLGLITSNTAVGHFAAADRLVKATQGLISPVSQVVYPHIARLHEQDKTSALAFVAKLLRWMGLGTLALSFALFAFAGPLVDLLFGSQFEDSKSLIRLMALIPFFVGVSNVLGVQTMLNFGMKRPFSVILLASGIINLVFLMMLVRICGAAGAAISVLMTEVIVVLAMAVVLAHRGYLLKLTRQY